MKEWIYLGKEGPVCLPTVNIMRSMWSATGREKAIFLEELEAALAAIFADHIAVGQPIDAGHGC
jgi:hypothetical protein